VKVLLFVGTNFSGFNKMHWTINGFLNSWLQTLGNNQWENCISLDFHFRFFKCTTKSAKIKGILSTSCVIFSYPKLLSISVLIFIKWRLNTELLMNTLRNVVFSTKKADHRYRKLINYALTWARPTLFIYLFLCQ
jgi:hypothetical protein